MFVPATPIEGSIVLNLGYLMERWTSDRLRATVGLHMMLLQCYKSTIVRPKTKRNPSSKTRESGFASSAITNFVGFSKSAPELSTIPENDIKVVCDSYEQSFPI